MYMQGFASGAWVGELCRKRPWAALCQSQLSPATSGTSDSNTWHAKTAARQGTCGTPASMYLWKTCSHRGKEDAHGDRRLEARGWGDSWRCAAEGCGRNTARGTLKEGPHAKRHYSKGTSAHRQAMPRWGDPRGTTAHGHPTPWRDTSEGLKPTDDPCQAGTLRMKERQRKNSQECQTEITMYLTPTTCTVLCLTKGTRRD